MLDDPRVVAGRQPRRTSAAREREQLREPKAPVAARARIRRLSAGIGVDERLHDRGAERFAGVERHVRETEPVTRLARRDHGLRRAAGTLRRGRFGIDPEPERDPDRRGAGPQQSHRAVHAAAHRDGDPLGIRLGAEDRPDRVRERVDDESLAGDRGRFEQRQADERGFQPVRVRVDDPVAVEDEANDRPVATASCVSGHFDHRRSGYPSRVIVPHPADDAPPRCEPGRARWVPCPLGLTPSRTRAPCAVMLVQLLRRGHAQSRARPHYTN